MKKYLTASVCLSVAAVSWAADIALIRTDAASTSSFNSYTNWSDQLAPSAGKTYQTTNQTLRTPEGSGPFVFLGDRLTVSSSGALAWKSLGAVTVSNLVLESSVQHWYGALAARLYGGITIPASRTAGFSAGSETDQRTYEVYSTISGSGNLLVSMDQITNYLKQTFLFATNSGFTGRTVLRGRGKFGICFEESLGPNPAAFTANQLEFNGTTLIATNSLTLDDPNRGFVLNNTLNAASQIYPGGVIEVSASATATVVCVISGPGPLTKRGPGTLLLATNNTYTGLTTVESGTLRLLTNALPVSASVVVTGSTAVVSGEGALSNVTLTAGGFLAAEKGGWAIKNLDVQNTTNVTFALDLTQANPNAALIRVSGTLSKQVLQAFQFVVNSTNTTVQPYKVLSAPNLASFADYDFCVTPPWSGELSRADDGAGGQVLLFTPTPPDKVVFKGAADVLGDTSFTNRLWSDGQIPSVDKTYVCRTNGMRTPAVGSLIFGGKRLIVDNAMGLALKGPGAPTITNLVMMNDASFGLAEPGGGRTVGDILLHPVRDASRTYAMRVTNIYMGRYLYLYSMLSGYGDLFLQAYGNPAYSNCLYILSADNTNYFGKVRVDGNTNFWLRIASEVKLGGNPPLFRADQLSFNGGGVSVTNDVTLDDGNRGITLAATGGTQSFATDNGAGGYTNNTPAAERRYEGGCVLRPEGASTLTVTCPITGAGTLIKNGDGTLVLGGANSYTGQTLVIAGTLRPASTNAFGTGPVLVKGTGVLARRHPDATMPNGVELGAAITFEDGSRLDVVFANGFTVTGNFTVPLFTVPSSVAISPATVPVRHSLTNYRATVTTSTVGARTLVSAQLTFQGSMMLVK